MKSFLPVAALSGALAVAIGAFGAHILKSLLDKEMFDIFLVGVQYHFYHTFALLAVGILEKFSRTTYSKWAGYLFASGIVVFSGFLYLLALSGLKILGAIVPIGGLMFISGWVSLALHCMRGGNSLQKY